MSKISRREGFRAHNPKVIGSSPIPATNASSSKHWSSAEQAEPNNKSKTPFESPKESLKESLPKRVLSQFTIDLGEQKKYKKARLVIPEPKSQDQRWRIVYWCFDAQKGKMCRQRLYAFNDVKDLALRTEKAKALVDSINRKLRKGFYLDRRVTGSAEVIQPDIPDSGVANALKTALQAKQGTSVSTYTNYRYHLNNFILFLRNNQLVHALISDITPGVAHRFLIDLKVNPMYSPRKTVYSQRTVDNHLTSMKALFEELLKIYETNGQNPFSGINPKDKAIGKHHAFSKEETRMIMDYCRNNGLINYEWISKFMYYTLARTSEISRIQIREIGQNQPNKLFIPKHKAKNRIERQVDLHPEIMKYLEEYDVKSLPGEWYLFSLGFGPGPKLHDYRSFGGHYRDKVLKPLGFSQDYTLYSWKHTGVVSAHESGVPDYNLMMQGGWRTYSAFQRYLKSLGLKDNSVFTSNIPQI